MNKIIITGDILRMSKYGLRSTQNGNIEWLSKLISPAISYVCGLPIETIYFRGDHSCTAKSVYQLNNLTISFSSWIRLATKTPSSDDEALIYCHFHDSLVIGFELPELFKICFDKLKIPYLDLTFHPVRFMDDLLFGVQSNLVNLPEVLSDYIAEESLFYAQAGLVSSSLSRLPKLQPLDYPANYAVFAGQTADDRVLFHGNRIVQFQDIMHLMNDMCQNHDKVFVKPHPYATENPIIEALLLLFPNTELITDNFYHIITHNSIKSVYSISSSASIEATYFGKRGRHMLNYPLHFNTESSLNAFLSIQANVYDHAFWEAIFTSIPEISLLRTSTKSLPSRPNRIRNSIRQYWGADIFEKI